MSGVSSREHLMSVVFTLFAGAVLTGACDSGSDANGSDAVVFEGARVIVGDRSVIEDAVFVVEGGRFTQPTLFMN